MSLMSLKSSFIYIISPLRISKKFGLLRVCFVHLKYCPRKTLNFQFSTIKQKEAIPTHHPLKPPTHKKRGKKKERKKGKRGETCLRIASKF